MDPADVRRRNLLRPDAFPHSAPTGMEYDTGDYPAALEQVLAAANYSALRAEQAARRIPGAISSTGSAFRPMWRLPASAMRNTAGC